MTTLRTTSGRDRCPMEQIMAADIDGTLKLARPAGCKILIADRNEIANAGIEVLLQAAGHRVIARCSHEDDLLRSVEAYRPDMIVLADNIVGQKVGKTFLRPRARNLSVPIIFLLEEHDATKGADMLDLGVEGILLSTACARSVIDCVESVRRGRKWVDPDLLRHLTMGERPSQIASSLTSREAEIAHLVSRGLRNKEIARELHLSLGTVKMYLHHIFEKLRLNGRTQLALSMAGARATTKPPDYTCSNRRGRLFLLPFFLHQSSFFDTIALFLQI